ncbi:major facilitator superfamily-domain-containing protein [Coniochaeta sp. 2T2.1]|nr:major facilitator superfamily-domain-containing protein [Coniochaeta sp. 2T2.1]
MASPRPASTVPESPGTEADLRTASEAMKRAAEAMIAVTESFRRQFHGQQDDSSPTRPYTYHADETRDEDLPDALWPRDGAMPGERHSKMGSNKPSGVRAHGRSKSSTNGTTAGRDRMSSTTAPPPSSRSADSVSKPMSSYPPTLPHVAAPRRLGDDIFTKRPALPRVRTTPPSFGAEVTTSSEEHAPRSSQMASLTPTADWPITTDSAPVLAPIAGAPAIRTGPGPQWPGGPYRSSAPPHVDLMEAAGRIKAQQQFPYPPDQLQIPHGPFHGAATDMEEPSPVLQIGGHTYVRSTEDFRSTLLTNEVRPQPTRMGSIARSGSATIRRRNSPPKVPSTRPAGFSPMQEILFVLLVCLAQVLMLAGISQALVPAAIIGQSFHDTTPGALAWYSAAYGLTSGTFVLPAGRLGDLFGHKKLFIIGFLWFAAWSCVTGFAEMVEKAGGGGGTVFFCFSRAMQGIGPALLVPNGQAMLGRAYKPGPRKNMVMSLFGAAAPLGFVLGAVMASLFAVKASWPWAFWSMGGVNLALAAVSVLVIPSAPKIKRPGNESLWMQLDGGGMAFGVCGLVLFNFAFNQAPIVSWATPYTYFILIIAVMLLAAFIYTEIVAPHPLVPIVAMKAQTNSVLGCTAAGWACFSIWVYYAFAIIQGIRGWSPLLSSAAFAQAPVAGFAASMLTGYLMGKIKPHWIMFISMCAFFVGSLLLVTAPVDQNYWYNIFWSILIMPFGMDMSNPAAIILLSNSVSKEHQGIAASLVVTVVNYSISLALGVGGTIEVNTNSGGRDILGGYRGAQFFGLGLGALGIVLAAAFLLQSYSRTPQTRKA